MPVGQSSLPYLNFQQKDLQDHWRAQEALAEELAVKHGKTVKWMKEAVLRVGKYGASPRKVAPHNAWLHAKSLEINPNLDPSEKENVIALQHVAKEAGSWRDIPKEEMDKMMRSLEAKSCSTWPVLQDIVAVCDHPDGTPPSQHVNDFIEIVLGWDINEFCLKYESFALFRLKGHGMTERKGVALNNNDKAVMTHQRVCGKITCALREITGNPTLDMSWKNHKKDIVDEYHVILEGWPSLVFDPLKLGFKGLESSSRCRLSLGLPGTSQHQRPAERQVCAPSFLSPNSFSYHIHP
ncbi:hypothetical protein K439DRAFT_1624956 [Ramaria rubella]|nr:hypothetical protein K439DRAFT_1624956 [Ramaria rubella]